MDTANVSDRYHRTPLPEVLTVSSIVTIYYIDLDTPKSNGESHNFWEFLYVDKGELQIFLDGIFYQVKSGQMLMYPPNAYHGGTPLLGSVGIISFECDSPLLDTFRGKVLTLNTAQKELLSQMITSASDLLHPAFPETGKLGLAPNQEVRPSQLQILKNKLQLFLLDLYESNSSVPAQPPATNQYNYKRQQFEALVSYMKEHLHTSISLEELSEVLDISVSQLKLIFRQNGGSGPIAYFNALKIAEAKQLICKSSMNMTQISEYLGFESVHYFSRLFKKTVGQTPTAFARSICKK